MIRWATEYRAHVVRWSPTEYSARSTDISCTVGTAEPQSVRGSVVSIEDLARAHTKRREELPAVVASQLVCVVANLALSSESQQAENSKQSQAPRRRFRSFDRTRLGSNLSRDVGLEVE